MNYDKVIFLDIEGVIVTHRTILDKTTDHLHYHGGRMNWEQFIDTGAMSLIWRIAVKHNAVIVLTSTIRFEKLTISGLLSSKPDWLDLHTAISYLSTEVTEKYGTREEQIRAFVQAHGTKKFVVIDDRELEIENFIGVNPRDGFSMANYYEAQHHIADDPTTICGEPIFL
jgi:hypothetical protein